MTRVFIDGAVGTTGLEIFDRLAGRRDLTVTALDDDRRKDAPARRDALNAADIALLCLPDDAAREAVALIENPATRVLDASTAHRIAPDWAYGFPELEPGGRETIAAAACVSNPGCYATGFLALIRPLVAAGLLPADWPVSCNAVSGYSGGGKAMIAAFEAPDAPDATETAYRLYSLRLGHKHVPEMQRRAGFTHPPLFTPAVTRTYRGMLVEAPLPLFALTGGVTAAQLRDCLAERYAGSSVVQVAKAAECSSLTALTVEQRAGSDGMDLYVFDDPATGQARMIAALDNLGKGAAGAAVQNLNLMAGLKETAGLRL